MKFWVMVYATGKPALYLKAQTTPAYGSIKARNDVAHSELIASQWSLLPRKVDYLHQMRDCEKSTMQ